MANKISNTQHSGLRSKSVLPLLFLASIVGLSLPFVYYQLGWLSLFGAVPFLYFLRETAQKKLSAVRQLGLIWAVGIAVFMITLSWALQTEPDKWASISGWQAVLALWSIYFVFVTMLSLQYLVFGCLYLIFKPKLYSKTIFIILPAMWCLAEAVRSILFSIFMAGPGGSIGIFWNFGALGVASAVTPLGYLSRVVGMFGLGFLVVVVNICIFWLLQRRWKLAILILLGIAFSSLICYAVWRPPAESKKITVGYLQQSLIYQQEQADLDFYDFIATLVSPLKSKTDVLVLPEYSQFFKNDALSSPAQLAQAQDTARAISEADGSIIVSTENSNSGKKLNRVVLYSVTGAWQAYRDKTFLIPLGEYLPNMFIAIFKLLSQEELLASHQQTRQISQGSAVNSVLTGSNNIQIGALACSGAIAPELYRELALGGAEVLTNSANLGIFSNAPIFHQQSQQFARFIAISNSRPYIQSAVGAYSYILNSDGEFLAETTNPGFRLDSAQLDIGRARTIYTIFGEWVVWLSAFILLVFGYLRINKYKK